MDSLSKRTYLLVLPLIALCHRYMLSTSLFLLLTPTYLISSVLTSRQLWPDTRYPAPDPCFPYPVTLHVSTLWRQLRTVLWKLYIYHSSNLYCVWFRSGVTNLQDQHTRILTNLPQSTHRAHRTTASYFDISGRSISINQRSKCVAFNSQFGP